MSQTPEEIRADIERTRNELGTDVDALADKVTPSKIVGRQTDKVRSAVGSVRDRVMGAADSASGSASSAGDSIADASQHAVEKAKGNPLAVGLIAFGIGWLAASLIPASSAEKELAETVKDKAQPLVQGATDAAKQVGENLKEPAQNAADAVKGSATDAADNVRSDAQSAAGDVQDQANSAKHAVQSEQQ